MGPVASPENGSASGLGVSDLPDLPKRSSYTLAPGRPSPGSTYPPASPLRLPVVRTLPYPSLGLDRTGRPARPSHTRNAVASVLCLSPVTLSARNHLTSELLRTLSRVAASKPTSWLSGRLHILSHLAQTSGP